MSFFAELKRRNVFKVGIAYVIVAWLLLQVVSIVAPALHLPEWTLSFITLLIIIGFPLAIFLAWAYELTPEGIRTTTPAGPARYHTQTTGQRLNYTIIVLLSLAVIFLVIDNYLLNPGASDSGLVARKEKSSDSTSDTGQMTSNETGRSIAVLPFTNMSEDRANEYFADGIAEELLNSLARIKDLEVRGRTSSFYFKGRSEDLHTISQMLNVENIIEGSVRKAGNQVRITVQLINTRTDAHLWSQTYDRTLDDIFAVQEDIAKSVANALQITLGVGELGRATGMTRNVEAYDAYLAGRSLMRQPGRENISRAIEQYEQAVAIDPDFAVAWAALVRVFQPDLAMALIPERLEEFIARRDAASARVMALAPKADFTLRIAAEQSGDRVEVERLRKQALDLDPAGYESNISYGQFLTGVGRPTQAIDYHQRAIRAEPLVSAAYQILGLSHEMSGNSPAAMTALKRSRELSNQPAFINVSLFVIALEENNRALIDEYAPLAVAGEGEINPNTNRPGSRNLNQVMLPLLDKPETARAELRKFLSDPAYTAPVSRLVIAIWASYFGEHELALQIYQEASKSRAFPSITIWRPIHQPMRRLPGFRDLVTKLGLVDYWRTTGDWGEFCRPAGEADFECNQNLSQN